MISRTFTRRPRSSSAGRASRFRDQWTRLWDKRTEMPSGPWHRVIAGGRLACVADGAVDPHRMARGVSWSSVQVTDDLPWDPCLHCLED